MDKAATMRLARGPWNHSISGRGRPARGSLR